MTKALLSLVAMCALQAGCVAVPQGNSSTPGPACPFSQAAGGSCAPDKAREFCPPGDARAGLCKPR